MNSWKTFMLQQTKPRKSMSKNYYHEILGVSSAKSSLFYDVAGYNFREKEAYTAQQRFARRLVRLNEED